MIRVLVKTYCRIRRRVFAPLSTFCSTVLAKELSIVCVAARVTDIEVLAILDYLRRPRLHRIGQRRLGVLPQGERLRFHVDLVPAVYPFHVALHLARQFD